MQTHYEEMTDKELRKLLKTWGWMLKKDGDQYEVHPKGERGDWSYFTTDKVDALGTAAAESRAMFNTHLRHITNEEVKGALLLWFSTFRAGWRERLFDAWYTGNYGIYNTHQCILYPATSTQYQWARYLSPDPSQPIQIKP